jgi:hypothetical protein
MLALLLTVPLLLSPPAPPPEEPPASIPQCLAVKVSSPHSQASRSSRKGDVFSATEILELQLSTILRRRLGGPHLLELKVYTPKGHLYQVLAVPFGDATSSPAGRRARKRHVAGYPRPLEEGRPEWVAVDGARRLTVSTSLPVAGTSIVTGSLYGRWTVVPHLDEGPEPCGAARRFTIRQ